MNANNGDGPTRGHDLSELVFVLVPHLEERWLERVGEPFNRERIRQETFDAVFSGRWSRDKPVWLGTHAPEPSDYVYAWPVHYRYAYVVRFGGRSPRHFLVRTVLTPTVREERGLRAGLLDWLRRQAGEA